VLQPNWLTQTHLDTGIKTVVSVVCIHKAFCRYIFTAWWQK